MNLDKALDTLAGDPSAAFDMAELSLELARDEHPDLDVEAYLSELDGMAREARAFLGGGLDKRVAGLCRFLFHEMGFRGNVQHYYDPRNSYLNQVMDRRTGIPITLSAVAIAIGQRAGLQVLGVGLPGHFVAKAVEGSEEVFFDPFHGGRRLTLENCEQLVEQVTGTPFRATPSQLEATTLGATVQRMLSNLKGIYLRESDFSRAVRVIQRLRRLNPHDPLLLRDLGVSLVHAGQPGKAIGPLKAYLATSPSAAAAVAVQEFLDKAQGDVAKWN
jgi:regulator of sirC expression with transglutaminase-like and TPR domain